MLYREVILSFQAIRLSFKIFLLILERAHTREKHGFAVPFIYAFIH